MPETIFMKLDKYIKQLEPISTTYFINSSHLSVYLYVYVSRQRLGKNLAVATNMHAAIEELLYGSFYTRSVSFQSSFLLPYVKLIES
jgi:hypothetical protein